MHKSYVNVYEDRIGFLSSKILNLIKYYHQLNALSIDQLDQLNFDQLKKYKETMYEAQTMSLEVIFEYEEIRRLIEMKMRKEKDESLFRRLNFLHNLLIEGKNIKKEVLETHLEIFQGYLRFFDFIEKNWSHYDEIKKGNFNFLKNKKEVEKYKENLSHISKKVNWIRNNSN